MPSGSLACRDTKTCRSSEISSSKRHRQRSGRHAGREKDRRNGHVPRGIGEGGPLLDGSGLQASSKGWRIKYSGKKRTVGDGPFTESKELMAGYTLIQVKSRKGCSSGPGVFPIRRDGKEGEIEVRQLFELEDFAPSDSIERLRRMGIGGK